MILIYNYFLLLLIILIVIITIDAFNGTTADLYKSFQLFPNSDHTCTTSTTCSVSNHYYSNNITILIFLELINFIIINIYIHI